MVLRLKQEPVIENLGHVPAEVVSRLRGMLARGASAQADSRRENFYEIENADRVFWVHLSPVTGHVVLLASWQKPQVNTTAAATRAA
jgi:hypothetical protein